MNGPESQNGNPSVLGIDSDSGTIRLMKKFLPEEGFEFQGTTDMEEGIAVMVNDCPDIVLVEEAGYRQVLDKRPDTTSVVVLQDDYAKFKPEGILDAGAAHVDKKPFNPEVLASQMRAIERRARRRFGNEMEKIEVENICFDPKTRLWTKDGVLVRLTGTEFQVAGLLAQNRGKILTNKEMLQKLWGYDDNPHEIQYLRVWISRLRRIFGDDNYELIKTYKNIGYGFGVTKTIER